MVDPDIIYEKTAIIQRCLKRIQEVTDLDPRKLDDIDVQEIFILNLLRVVQTAIDLAAHIIADEGLGLPGSLREHFRLLKDAGVMSGNIAEKMEAMVGFRNIAVHEYQNISVDMLKSILEHGLIDLETYYKSILHYFGLSS